jgi:hypothetical protein
MTYYCHKIPPSTNPKESWYAHIFQSPLRVNTCGPGPVVAIEFIECAEEDSTDYWGWQETGEKLFSMVYRDRRMLEMCFPAGTRPQVERRLGRAVNLKVREIDPARLSQANYDGEGEADSPMRSIA